MSLYLNLVIKKSPKSNYNTRQEQTDRYGINNYENYDFCFILHIGLLMLSLIPKSLKLQWIFVFALGPDCRKKYLKIN